MNRPLQSVFILIALLALCTVEDASAQSEFWRALPGPFGGSVDTFVHSPNGDIYAETGIQGTVKSTDDGATWQREELGLNTVLVHISQRGTMFIVDGWTATLQRAPLDSVERTNLPVGSPTTSRPIVERANGTLIMAGSDGVFRSVDDGVSWTRVGPDSVSFRFPALGPGDITFALSDSAGIFRSSDDGLSWVRAGDAPAYIGTSFIALESGDILVGGLYGGMYRSSDLGTSFTYSALENVKGQIGTIAVLPDDDILATSSVSGLFRISMNGVVTALTDPPRKDLHAVTITRSGSILLGYNGRGILRSVDDGVSFVAVGVAKANEIYSLTEGPDARIYARANGAISGFGANALYRSSDRGATWTDLRLDDEPAGRHVFAQHDAIVVGGAGAILRSTDDGVSWRKLWQRLEQIYDLVLTHRGSLIVGTDDGIFRSSDDGENWSEVLDSTRIFSMTESPGGDLWALTRDSTIHRSSDDGETWARDWIRPPSVIYGHYTTIESPGDSIIVLSTDNAIPWIVRSTDAGATWSAPAFTCGHGPFYLYDQRERGMFAVSGCGVYISRDRGASWDSIAARPLGEHDGLILAHSSGDLFYGGRMGVHVANLPTGIRDESFAARVAPITIAPITIAPNPSDENFSIGFNLSSRSQVSIVVRTIIGEHVSTVHDGVFDTGNHNVQCDHNLSPGSYIVEFTLDDYSETKLLHVTR